MLIIRLCKKATCIPLSHLFSYKDLKIRSWVVIVTAQCVFLGGKYFSLYQKNMWFTHEHAWLQVNASSSIDALQRLRGRGDENPHEGVTVLERTSLG